LPSGIVAVVPLHVSGQLEIDGVKSFLFDFKTTPTSEIIRVLWDAELDIAFMSHEMAKVMIAHDWAKHLGDEFAQQYNFKVDEWEEKNAEAIAAGKVSAAQAPVTGVAPSPSTDAVAEKQAPVIGSLGENPPNIIDDLRRQSQAEVVSVVKNDPEVSLTIDDLNAATIEKSNAKAKDDFEKKRIALEAAQAEEAKFVKAQAEEVKPLTKKK
jgi:hypothetical protein